jgi:hypothetical protein
MKFISIYSLIIFTILNLVPNAFEIINSTIVPYFNSYDVAMEGNVLIYVLDPNLYPHRNSGPFWEPGAFQGYLNLAIFFSIGKAGSIKFGEFFVLFLALLSTMSSTGYIVFGVIIIIYSLYFSKKKVKYMFIAPLIIISSIYIFQSIPFLHEKIDTQLSTSNIDSKNAQRFNSFGRDLVTFSDNYLVGTGSNIKNRYGTKNIEDISFSTTGITNFLATYGIFFSLFYIYSIYHGSRELMLQNNFINIKPLFFLIIFGLISFSEGFPFQPIFWGIAANYSLKRFKYDYS